MKQKDYAVWVARMIRIEGPASAMPPHASTLGLAATGLPGEVGEFIEHIKKYLYHNKPIDMEAVKLEAGDVLFYFTAALNELGITLDEVREANVDKLTKRYPERG